MSSRPRRHRTLPTLVVLLVVGLPATACQPDPPADEPVVVATTEPPSTAAPPTGPPPTAPATAPPATTPPATAPPATAVPTEPPLPPGVARPDWLGTRPLEVGPDGIALSAPTPEELVVRRIPTIDLLPPPADGAYHATIEVLTPEVVARSTWTAECPVTTDELRYLTMSFWGFDDRPHTGEMIVNATWAVEVTEIFRQLFEVRYPIEEMRIVAAAELEGTPTGDGNDTTGFVCRPVRGASSWSQHAYGLAIDINPFINPYQRDERILPELAGAYLDRSHVRPGMLFEGDTAVSAFDAIGWGWGGRWSSLVDWMHFSANGR